MPNAGILTVASLDVCPLRDGQRAFLLQLVAALRLAVVVLSEIRHAHADVAEPLAGSIVGTVLVAEEVELSNRRKVVRALLIVREGGSEEGGQGRREQKGDAHDVWWYEI